MGFLNSRIEEKRESQLEDEAIACVAPSGMVLNPSIENFMNIRQDDNGALLRRSFLGSREDLMEVYQKRRSTAGRRDNISQSSLSKLNLLQNVVSFNSALNLKRQTTKKL